MSLKKRSKASRKALESYPEWVRRNMKWQGGGRKRGEDPDFKSYGNY